MEEQNPQAWVGQDVVIFGPGAHRPTYGRLEGIGEFGVVLRYRSYVAWFTGEEDYLNMPQRDGEYRVVSELQPWHTVGGLRLQEEEEKRTYGLE